MRVEQLVEIHPVEMIAGEDQVIACLVAHEVAHRLAHGVRRALKPVGPVGRLLGREDLDEPVGEVIEPVRLRDVAVERRGVELRQDEDAPEFRVQTVGNRDVDQPVLPADRHGRLRPHVRQREQARAAPATENQREHVGHETILGVSPAAVKLG